MVATALALAASACDRAEVSRELGARCDHSDECDDRCLAPADYPGGFCTVSCDSDADCPGDARCADDEGGVCLFTCRPDVAGACDFLGAEWECTARDGKPDGEVDVCVGA